MISPVAITPPKTGSTTFWQAAAKHFGVEQLPASKRHGPIESKSTTRLDAKLAASNMNTTHHLTSDLYVDVDDSYNVAVFTRNPYTRVLSMMAFNACVSRQSLYNADISHWIEHQANFKSVMLHKIMRWCTCDFVHNRTNFQVVKFENYANDIKQIWNFDIGNTHHFETGNFNDLSKCLHFYNDKRIAFVNEQYQRDFDTFGYKQYSCYEEMVTDLK